MITTLIILYIIQLIITLYIVFYTKMIPYGLHSQDFFLDSILCILFILILFIIIIIPVIFTLHLNCYIIQYLRIRKYLKGKEFIFYEKHFRESVITSGEEYGEINKALNVDLLRDFSYGILPIPLIFKTRLGNYIIISMQFKRDTKKLIIKVK